MAQSNQERKYEEAIDPFEGYCFVTLLEEFLLKTVAGIERLAIKVEKVFFDPERNDILLFGYDEISHSCKMLWLSSIEVATINSESCKSVYEYLAENNLIELSFLKRYQEYHRTLTEVSHKDPSKKFFYDGEKVPLIFDYNTGMGGEVISSGIKFDIYRGYVFQNERFLTGYCYPEEGLRTFKLNKMRNIRTSEDETVTVDGLLSFLQHVTKKYHTINA